MRTTNAATTQRPEATMQPLIRNLGLVDYAETLAAMQAFTRQRQPDQADELWWVQHPPVYSQGRAGKPEHIRHAGQIPVQQSDRGGQVTYHGPGQWVAYLLVDLKRLAVGVQDWVQGLENSVIRLLADYGLHAQGNRQAPGVYLDGAKIASLGLRVSRKGCYHGISLNVAMDLMPFQGINPCGYADMPVTQLQAHCPHITMAQVQQDWQVYLLAMMTPAAACSDSSNIMHASGQS